MPAIPEKGLHANRPYSIPTAGGTKNCFSRSDILEGRTPTAFGSEQSLGILTTGITDDPATWPKKWYNKGRLLRVPKCVILSSFPFWTLYWPRSYFYFPRDVIGDSGYGFLNNYYYLEQWNGVDPTITEASPDYDWISGYDLGSPSVLESMPSQPGYQNNRAWNDMRNLDPAEKQTVYNTREACRTLSDTGEECNSIPQYLINKCPSPPLNERFFKGVSTLENPYYDIHPRLLDAFLQAKAILESDPDDPIYVLIPAWMGKKLYQVRNAYLKQTHEKTNKAHGGSINGRPCEVFDSIPCWDWSPICWAPPYPDVADPRNGLGFDGPTVPWISSTDPGFGTNTLHIYIGHPNVAYTSGRSLENYQAWPLSPEIQYIAGPAGTSSYLGDPRPYYAGRRPVWRAAGFDYGYVNHGPSGLYDTRYGPMIEAAAENWKANFWKYRNIGTRIFTYDAQWNFSWNFNKLYDDRRGDCPSTQFFSGYDFNDFVTIFGTEDRQFINCAPQFQLAFAEAINWFPSRASIDEAIGVGVRLTQRVMDYYRNNDTGSADFFQLALDRNGLGDFNISFEGPAPGSFFDADGLVAYVRSYFKDHP